MLFRSFLAFSLVFTAQTAFAQVPDILMRTRTVSANTCGALFLDSLGSAGGYANNQLQIMTICSSDPTRNHISIGFDFLDLKQGDELCFFDGPTVNDSLLACSSDFGSSQNTIVETTARGNGCLTIRFRSNNDNIQGQGWAAHILCIPSCQTVKAKIEATIPAIMPADTGWVDGCPNVTRVSFKGMGIYPFNNVSYTQSDALSKFEWNFGDGTAIAYGPEVDHIFAQAGGYIVKLVITDTVGCQNINYIKQRVRISPRPTFNTGALVSQVCTGTEIRLRGQSQQLDTSYQVSTQPNSASFPIVRYAQKLYLFPTSSLNNTKQVFILRISHLGKP